MADAHHIVPDFIPPNSTIPAFIDSVTAAYPPESPVLAQVLAQLQQFEGMRLSIRRLQHHLLMLLRGHPDLYMSFVSNLLPTLIPYICEYDLARYVGMVQAENPDIHETVGAQLRSYVHGLISLQKLNAEVLPLLEDSDWLIQAYFNLVPRSRHLVYAVEQEVEAELLNIQLELNMELEEDEVQPLQEPEEINIEYGAEEPVAEEPVAEEPVAEEPVAEEPVAEEPVAEEPVAEEPVDEEPVDEEPVDEELVDEELVDEELVAGQAVAGQAVAGQAVAMRVFNLLYVIGIGFGIGIEIGIFGSFRR